jgi:putative GTP pyrophosphokinase
VAICAICIDRSHGFGQDLLSLFEGMESDELEADYRKIHSGALEFLREFLHQFEALVAKANVKLGVPIEGRVKEWSSISEKLVRKSLDVKTCQDLDDFIGIRVITLFARDVSKICRLMEKTFLVGSRENKADTLVHPKRACLDAGVNFHG